MKTQTLETVTQALSELNNSKVVIKLKNGRVISGPLKGTAPDYTLKLGALHLRLDAENISFVIAHP
jgi:hypothetical protein